MNTNIDEKKLNEIIEYLEDNPFDASGDFVCDSKIYGLLSSLGIDENYQENYAQIDENEIEKMSLDNLKTMYTFILRGERFCRGHIASYVIDGSLLKLAKRHLEIINAYEQVSK